MRNFVNTLAWGFCLLIASISCTERPDAQAPLSLKLTNGSTVSSLIKQSDVPVALLIYDPEMCLTCSSELPEFLDMDRKKVAQVLLVFTRELTDDEKRRVLPLRLPIAGTLEAGTVKTSTEFLLVNGVVKKSSESEGIHKAKVLQALKQEVKQTASPATE